MKTENFWSLNSDQILEKTDSKLQGLDNNQVNDRLRRDGQNVIKTKEKNTPFRTFIRQFNSPVTIVLMVATLISIILRDYIDSMIILVIILCSSILSFFQEYNASNIVESLLTLISTTSHVVRNNTLIEVNIEELVVGDILSLTAGDIIPADCYLLESSSLLVDESMLTGENFPIEKKVDVLELNRPLSERTNCLWMGTHVTSGSGKAVIVNPAKYSEFGSISKSLSAKEKPTEFEIGIHKFGNLLMRVTVILVLLLFLVNILLKKSPFESLLFALALSVGLMPQLLPAIISVNLAHGSKELYEKKVVVKKLSTIENFGSMNILCSDKTGTITKGEVTLHMTMNLNQQEDSFVFLSTYLNSSLQNSYTNPIDLAIQKAKTIDVSQYQLIKEIPYNFKDKRMSVLVQTPLESQFNGKKMLISKGAFEKMLEVCTTALINDQIEPIEQQKKYLMNLYNEYSQQGFRVLGLASKEIKSIDDLDNDLTLIGLITLYDPLKDDIKNVVSQLNHLGVSLKIITGDNHLVAKNVAHALNLNEENILTGKDIESMNHQTLKISALKTDIFAEIDPNQKERIILALKDSNNVVGYMGDGINDAPAIHVADVGISVDSAANVAKNAASIVLMQQDLNVIVDGIYSGRKTFANTMKYIFMATSANFGNMFSMFGASLILPFLPLLPKQILATNIITDFPEMNIASDTVDPIMITQPHRLDVNFIKKFMFLFGFISSIFDYLTFGVLILLNSSEATFQSAWFTESILSASMIVLVMRTRMPFFKNRPGKGLLIATISVMILTLILPYTFMGPLLNIYPLSSQLYLIIFIIVLLYVITAEIAKHYFYKRVKN